jgi:hypothetical protein
MLVRVSFGAAMLPRFYWLFIWKPMRKTFVIVFRFFVFLSSMIILVPLPLVAEETEMDMDLMQTIESTNDNLSSNIALENVESAVADAQTLNQLFTVVAEHYQKEMTAGKDVNEAVDLTRKSIKFSDEIITFLQQQDFDSAANTATDLARTCKTCHNFYKED